MKNEKIARKKIKTSLKLHTLKTSQKMSSKQNNNEYYP